MKVLYSWIGHTDLQCFNRNVRDSTLRAKIIELLPPGKGGDEFKGVGPIETVLGQESYDSITLLWSYPQGKLMQAYQEYIGKQCRVIPAYVKNPIDYGEIYKIVDEIMAREEELSEGERYIQLSSGTPAMGAIWLLLGKTKYPSTFLQVYKGKTIVTDMPFDLRVEMARKLFREHENIIQELPDKLLKDASGFKGIIGESPSIQRCTYSAKRAALYDVNVLLTGESGTGKEMFAQAIHKGSHRQSCPFVTVNCGALSEALLESELFGYRKAAFTGASKDKDGLFKDANGGTLFLDEIGECSLEMQKKLLRVLQPPANAPLTSRIFKPVGSTVDEQSDVRIIAATNKNLLDEIDKGTFRADLYYRLAYFTIRLPSLNERQEDIPLIATHLLERINAELSSGAEYVKKHFAAEALTALEHHYWKGNVRELLNAITQAAVMVPGETIRAWDLDIVSTSVLGEETSVPHSREPFEDLNLDQAVDRLKKSYIQAAIKRAGNSKTRTYQLLGMKSYQRLDAMMKSLNIKTEFD